MGGSVLRFVEEGDSEAELRAEADAFASRHGPNAYSQFIHKHAHRPDRAQAATIGRLIGRRVRASDGTLQPTPGKAERAAKRAAKHAQKAEARVDAELSRAIDAIAFLAQNEIDPAPLIARISPMEAEAVSANLKKAVEWLSRFADGWQSHVYIGNVETKGRTSGHRNQAGRAGLRLVRCSD